MERNAKIFCKTFISGKDQTLNKKMAKFWISILFRNFMDILANSILFQGLENRFYNSILSIPLANPFLMNTIANCWVTVFASIAFDDASCKQWTGTTRVTCCECACVIGKCFQAPPTSYTHHCRFSKNAEDEEARRDDCRCRGRSKYGVTVGIWEALLYDDKPQVQRQMKTSYGCLSQKFVSKADLILFDGNSTQQCSPPSQFTSTTCTPQIKTQTRSPTLLLASSPSICSRGIQPSLLIKPNQLWMISSLRDRSHLLIRSSWKPATGQTANNFKLISRVFSHHVQQPLPSFNE